MSNQVQDCRHEFPVDTVCNHCEVRLSDYVRRLTQEQRPAQEWQGSRRVNPFSLAEIRDWTENGTMTPELRAGMRALLERIAAGSGE